MTDRLTPSQRHHCMSRIRSKDTKPELKVRQWLWQARHRHEKVSDGNFCEWVFLAWS